MTKTRKVEPVGGELVEGRFVRVETVLRDCPLHALQSQGSEVDAFTLWATGPKGKRYVSFRASFNRLFGTPGPLAFRIERLVIDPRIDEYGDDVPQILRLGTFRDVCEMLGIGACGKHFKLIKDALQQLVGTTLETNFEYRAGRETHQMPDLTWNRFEGVACTGDALDGAKVDAIYLKLTSTYQDILQKSVRRPLDYDYLRDLAPAAARLYEIVSVRIYAALLNGGRKPEARMLYSEFSERAGLKRYAIGWEMRRQMEKLHAPHLASGYFASVSYEAQREDWMMIYTPGPKARKDFDRARKKGEAAKSKQAAIAEVQTLLPLPPTAPLTEKQMLAERLAGQGISHVRAQALVELHEESARLWLDVAMKKCLGKNIRDVAAYLTSAISDDRPAPEAYAAAIEAEKRRTAAPKVQRPTRKAVTAPAPEVDPLSALSVDELAELREEAFSAMTDRERRQIDERVTDAGREALIRSKMIEVFAARAS